MRKNYARVFLCRCTLGVAAWCLATSTTFAWEESVERATVKPPQIKVLRDVEYGEEDGAKLLADVYLPPNEEQRPGVLMVHGGAWMTGSKSHVVYHAKRVADAGYTVVAINYRLAPKHKFPAQLDDCRTALQWMRRHADDYHIDPQRIAGYGYSAGAHLVSLLGVLPEYEHDGAASDAVVTPWRIQAVVAGGTPADFVWMPQDNSSLAYVFGGTRKEKPDLYRLASPLRHVTTDDPPMFFYHGDGDLLVPKSNGITFHAKVKETGIKTKLMMVPKSGHLATFLNRNPPGEAIEFLNETLDWHGPANAREQDKPE